MTVPISNTSPLTNLAAIGQFDVLQRLYSRLLIAEAKGRGLVVQFSPVPGPTPDHTKAGQSSAE